MAAVEIPKGIVRIPWALTRESAGVTLSDSVANTESEILSWQCPRNMSVAVKAGDRLWIELATAGLATIVKGTVRGYIADANKVIKAKFLEHPINALNAGASGTRTASLVPTGDPSDREKMFRLPSGFAREADEFILFTFEGADVSAAAELLIILEGTQFVKV